MNLTTIVLSHLPAEKIKPTLKSVSFADKTTVIYNSKPVKDFAKQRNLGLKTAKTDWVLFVDSDEVVSKKLRQEIKKAIRQTKFSAFYINRRDVFHGQTLKHGETGHTKIIRLAKKTAGKFTRPVHETWKVKGRVGELSGFLEHRKENLVSGFLTRIARYGPLDSAKLTQEGKPFSYSRLFLYPFAKFVQNYIVRRGTQDGSLGLFHAYLMSVQSLSVRVFQWQDRV